MLEKLSIEWKLPLAICSVLMAVVVTLSAVAYREVATSTHRVAASRVESFAGQLADTFHSTVDEGLVRLGARAAEAPLVDYLRASDRAGSVAREAHADLAGLLVAVDFPVEFAAVQLVDLDRRVLLAVGPDRESIAELPLEGLIPSPAPGIGGVGTLVALGDRIVVPAYVPVVAGKDLLGYVVRWSYVELSPESRAQILGFLSPEASAFLGSIGGLWIDWQRIVPEPVVDLTRLGQSTLVERPEGVQLAAAARVPDTPWVVVVELPEALVMAPARRLLVLIGGVAASLLLVGFGGVWLLARRITGPLRELTVASESLVGDARVNHRATAREDELGRLRTSFQRMSERVHDAHHGLEAKVVELRAARAREHAARAEAEDANSRKDEFLAMLAHELRNPLSPILCALAVVRSARASHDARDQALAAIERQVRNMTRIVEDLLDVSRITRGRVALQCRPSDVGTLVRNALETARPLIEVKQHRVQCALPQPPLALEVDPTRLEQILANLLTNAAKYTEQGGRIWVSAGLEGDEVLFRVRDNGIGIPADKLPRIFDLFHQVDVSVARSRGGLGVGLTLVRKLVELHGGSVTASSAGAGQGSEFVVRIPARAAVAAACETPRVAVLADGLEALRVLVVEDRRDARDMLELALTIDGHDVVTAGDGDEGLARFRSFDPQVVVLDIGLPGMDGFEVARRIRAEGRRDVLLIAATGYGDSQTRVRAIEIGFDAHLVKPIAHSELASVLSRTRGARVANQG